MRDMEEYVEEVRKKTGYPVSKDDPLFIVYDFFRFFEEDFRNLSRQSLESWIMMLDKRRAEFNTAISTRTERVVRESLRLTRSAVQESFQEASKAFYKDVRDQLDQERKNFEQDRRDIRRTCVVLAGLVGASLTISMSWILMFR